MMHTKRRWVVTPVATAEELSQILSQRTWTLCTGFYVEGFPDYLFLNDATSEDGAGEYAVIRGGIDASKWVQIESITFSWCDLEKALGYIRHTLAGEDDANDFAHPVDLRGRLHRPGEHGHCHLCA
jgi:hypothetical protein